MLEVLTGFIDELREAGLPISMRESLDASEALTKLSLDSRQVLKSALATTLIKHVEHRPIFESSFDVYFSRRSTATLAVFGDNDELAENEPTSLSPGGETGEQVVFDDALVAELVRSALLSGDRRDIDKAAVAAVARYGAVDATRPVGVSYYLHRTLRGVDLEGLLGRLLDNVTRPLDNGDGLARRLVAEDYRAHADALRARIEDQIKALLVSGRGRSNVARSVRPRLIEDVDFMHASTDELASMRRSIYPLARVLAARLERRRRHRRRGPLDFKATLRRSLSTGGVPIEPRFRSPHPHKPEIFLFADVSGSVASFARFTVLLVYAISMQFSNVRVVIFIDGTADVTDILKGADSIADALEQMSQVPDVVHGDGHSDYGNALSLFKQRHLGAITSRTNVIVLGDARNNYHAPNAEVLKELRSRARRVYWLNPEPRSYWGSGDSIIETYAKYCDAVFECRNLRQLKSFVDELA